MGTILLGIAIGLAFGVLISLLIHQQRVLSQQKKTRFPAVRKQVIEKSYSPNMMNEDLPASTDAYMTCDECWRKRHLGRAFPSGWMSLTETPRKCPTHHTRKEEIKPDKEGTFAGQVR